MPDLNLSCMGDSMNIRLLLLSSLFFNLLVSTAGATIYPPNPLLVILLMVKNEKERIVQTLETYVSKNESAKKEVAYVIYDTGSSDGTEDLAKGFFEKKEITDYAIIKESHWPAGKDFPYGKARNRALELVREKYPESLFILFPDAEWYLHTIDKLLTFCREESIKAAQGQAIPPYYHNRMCWGNSHISLTSRLIATHDDVKYDYFDRHECLNKTSCRDTPESVYFEIIPSPSGAERSRKRWESDRDYFLNLLLADPKDVRAAHYVAKSEKWLGNYRNAYIYYKMRRDLHSFPQEDWEGLYELGAVTEVLSEEEPDQFTWDEALKYYLEAIALRPHRAEPMVKIAQHYFFKEQKYGLSYIFARRACELPMPAIEKEILPIQTHCYTLDRWEILSLCAFYIGEYEVGEAAAKKAIEASPNSPHLYKNLSYYWERKNKERA